MKKRTTIYVDADLFSKFKEKCSENNTSMSRQYEKLMRSYITDINPTDDRMTVTDTMSVSLERPRQKEEKSWIKRKLHL